jgi:hypothetical protein
MLKRLLVTMAVAGSLSQPASATPSTVVILDGWWLTDYAKNACDYAERYARAFPTGGDYTVTDACRLHDPQGQVSEFGMSIRSEFVSSPACAGLTFGWFVSPNDTNPQIAAAMRAHWVLIVSFMPGLAKHDWTLSRPDDGLPIQGKDTARDIVRKVCTTVTGSGTRWTFSSPICTKMEPDSASSVARQSG